MVHLPHQEHILVMGLVKKTANISDSAVKACSPPDNKVIDCSLLPGGLTKHF